jgi:pyruvate ferredoxin oxidoreductase beta subunit
MKKDIAKIAVAHNIAYVARASVHNPMDLSMKAEKAFNTKGPAFLIVLQPCQTGWHYPMEKTMDMAKLAVDSKVWLYMKLRMANTRLITSQQKMSQ